MPTRYDLEGYWTGADTFGYDVPPLAPSQRQLDLAAEILASGLSPVLIVGCGPGALVTACRDIGVVAWGVDVSPWTNANPAPGAVAFLLDAADVRNAGQARRVMRDIDPALVVTEDLISCLTDSDAQTLDGFLRGWRTNPVVWHFTSTHEIMSYTPSEDDSPIVIETCPYNTAGREPDAQTGMVQLRTLVEWRALLGPGSRLIDHRGEVA